MFSVSLASKSLTVLPVVNHLGLQVAMLRENTYGRELSKVTGFMTPNSDAHGAETPALHVEFHGAAIITDRIREVNLPRGYTSGPPYYAVKMPNGTWRTVGAIVGWGSGINLTFYNSDPNWTIGFNLECREDDTRFYLEGTSFKGDYPPGPFQTSNLKSNAFDLNDEETAKPPPMSDFKLGYQYAKYVADICRAGKYGPGDLVTDCMKDLQTLNINTCTAVAGLITCAHDIKDVIAAAEGHVSVEWLNNLHLYMRYGWANTVRDSVELSKAFVRWANGAIFGRSSVQTTRASVEEDLDVSWRYEGASAHARHTLKVSCETLDHPVADLVRKAMDLDIFPELGNVWDIIPYSFCVDWLLPLGDMLDQVDANTYRSTLMCKGCTYTTLVTVSNLRPRYVPGCPDSAISTGCSLTAYTRNLYAEIPSPTLQLHSPPEFKQWIPAGSLVLQRVLSGKH